MTEPRDLEDVACDLCGGRDIDVRRPAAGTHVSHARAFTASSSAPLTDRLVQCRGCGLVYVSPRVPADRIVQAYAAGADAVYAAQTRARERTFETLLAKMEALTGARGSVFDVGAATGAFLAVARRRGWSVDGCEPNAWLAAWAAQHYGLSIRTGALDTLDLPAAACQAITFWDVIEHLPSPSAAVARAASLLEPGGYVFLTFPDIGSWWSRALGHRWPLRRAMHLYYFSRETMGRMLRAHGFEIVRVETHAPTLEFRFLVERAGDAAGLPGGALAKLADRLRVGRHQVPMRMGQAFVAARRVST